MLAELHATVSSTHAGQESGLAARACEASRRHGSMPTPARPSRNTRCSARTNTELLDYKAQIMSEEQLGKFRPSGTQRKRYVNVTRAAQGDHSQPR